MTDFGGGLGQRPNPYKHRGIHTQNSWLHGRA